MQAHGQIDVIHASGLHANSRALERLGQLLMPSRGIGKLLCFHTDAVLAQHQNQFFGADIDASE